MADLCDDGRFELIEKYKLMLMESTNISDSEDELKVLDTILFRFWQMGWLDKPEQPTAQQWIPCSEKLPEENGQYLISVKYVHVDGYVDIYAEHGDWADGKWDMFCFGHCGEVEGILAWMPLPEPWRGDAKCTNAQ